MVFISEQCVLCTRLGELFNKRHTVWFCLFPPATNKPVFVYARQAAGREQRRRSQRGFPSLFSSCWFWKTSLSRTPHIQKNTDCGFLLRLLELPAYSTETSLVFLLKLIFVFKPWTLQWGCWDRNRHFRMKRNNNSLIFKEKHNKNVARKNLPKLN